MSSAPDSDPQSSGSPVFLMLMIAMLLAVWGLVTDMIHTGGGGSIDLRNRITGVRAAAEHRDPYTYKWTRADGDRLWDPFDSPSSPVSHTTVTPVTLTAFLPFKNLDYRLTQWLWLAVEYAALGLGFLAWTRATAREHWVWGGLLTCLYCLTPHWRLHVDRGQSYVLYAALLLGMMRAGQCPRQRGPWMEGITGSLLTMLRPTFGVLLGVSAARRKKAALLAAGSGLILWALLPVLLAGGGIWKNYFAAMAVQARQYLDHVKFPPARFSAREVIEGIPIDKFLNFPRIPFTDTSLYRLISFQLPPNLLLGGWAVLAGLAGWLLMRRRETGTPRFWWAVSAWIYIGDYLLPAYRYNYNHILLWPMLLLGLSALKGRARAVWMILSSALLLLHTATWWLPNACMSWPGAASLALAAGVAAWMVMPPRKSPVPRGV
ncbi:MAG: glycosyltransferase family 87 protein [Verrucomicrobiota bacterium]